MAIGFGLMMISGIIYFHQYQHIANSVHREGVIVDTQWHKTVSRRVGSEGSWHPLIAFRPNDNYTLVFYSSTGSSFFEGSEGDTVDVVYPPNHPEEAELNSFWINFFSWGFIGITGLVFFIVGLLVSMLSDDSRRDKSKHKGIIQK